MRCFWMLTTVDCLPWRKPPPGQGYFGKGKGPRVDPSHEDGVVSGECVLDKTMGNQKIKRPSSEFHSKTSPEKLYFCS